MAHMSPICSTIVASEIGRMVIMAVIMRLQSGDLKTAIAVFCIRKGRPNHAASLTGVKSTLPRQQASMYEPMTPRSMGIIFIIPRPQMLQTMMMSMAARAIHQLSMQLLMAEPERVRPIAMMTGPVTIGGKKRITLRVPKIAKRAASTKYIRPAQNTPMQA